MPFQSTQVSSDSVADDWNKLVDSYARGIRYNSLALKHAWSGDYHAAAHVWLRASRSGFCDGRILFNLAVCYQNGLGITKDIAKVMDLWLCKCLSTNARAYPSCSICVYFENVHYDYLWWGKFLVAWWRNGYSIGQEFVSPSCYRYAFWPTGVDVH